MSLVTRIQVAGVAPILVIALVLVLVLATYAAGIFGPPRPGTTIDRLLSAPGIAAGLLLGVAGGVVAVLSCPAPLRPITASFFAGCLACAAIGSALFFDPWLGLLLTSMAATLPRSAYGLRVAPARPPSDDGR